MKKTGSILLGIALVIAGLVFALNSLGIADIDIFFDGWWTLFIIVPCVIGLFKEREKTGNLIGIAIGVFLLLCCNDILDFSIFRKLIIPAIIIILGLKLVLSGISKNKANEILTNIKDTGSTPKVACATFSGCNLNYDGEEFDGAELTAVFGGIECDLRNAQIQKDCAIQVCCVFGGIDILVPENVNVKANTTSIFGGVSNKTPVHKNVPTLYISGTCLFGGVDIK